MAYILRPSYAQGSDSGPFGTGCVNTISKEMGPFSASSEWNEWINFHSKWVSHQHGHSIWVHSALISHSIWVIFSPLIFNMGHLQHKYGYTFEAIHSLWVQITVDPFNMGIILKC